MSFQDKSIKCSDCSTTFTFSAGEQEFFRSKGFTEENHGLMGYSYSFSPICSNIFMCERNSSNKGYNTGLRFLKNALLSSAITPYYTKSTVFPLYDIITGLLFGRQVNSIQL